MAVLPELQVHEHLGDPALRARWDTLCGADPNASVFLSPRYQQAWVDVFGADADVTTLEVREGDDTIGIAVGAVAQEQGEGTWRFGGGTEVTDYTGPVAAPSRHGAVADLVVSAALGAASRAVFGGLPVDTAWPGALCDAIEASGTSCTTTAEDVCPVVDISEGHDAWMAALPGKLRQELKRKTRKLVRDIGSVAVEQADGGDLDAGLATFLGMQADAAGPKAQFFDRPVMRDWFRALADEFAGDDVFRLHLLSIGDRPAAATISLVQGGRWGLYNSAFDPALGALAPGMVLVTELIRAAADEGNHVFDLLRGDESYKYRFGAVDRELVAVEPT